MDIGPLQPTVAPEFFYQRKTDQSDPTSGPLAVKDSIISPETSVPLISSTPNSEPQPPLNRLLSKPSSSNRRLGGFVEKLSLREAKRMDRLKVASRTSSSISKKGASTPAINHSASVGMAREGVPSGCSNTSISSLVSKREIAERLGKMVGFHYREKEGHSPFSGAASIPQ